MPSICRGPKLSELFLVGFRLLTRENQLSAKQSEEEPKGFKNPEALRQGAPKSVSNLISVLAPESWNFAWDFDLSHPRRGYPTPNSQRLQEFRDIRGLLKGDSNLDDS
jgi:hypothetical protein